MPQQPGARNYRAEEALAIVTNAANKFSIFQAAIDHLFPADPRSEQLPRESRWDRSPARAERNKHRWRNDQPTPRLLLGPDESRSEEHTSELQSRFDLVCRLLLEKKKEITHTTRKLNV